MRKAVFFDRDGTLIEEAEYLSDPARMRVFPGVAEALVKLSDADYALAVITNQAGVARGFFDCATVELLNRELIRLLGPAGKRIEDVQYCPHHPKFTGQCECRKPEPGMLLASAKKMGVNLSKSWMVGDKEADVRAGKRAGCKTALVLTGYGKGEIAKLEEDMPDLIVENVVEFCDKILKGKI